MTSTSAGAAGTTPLTAPAPLTPEHTFEMRFTSTSRGAHLARLMAAERLHAWGFPYGTEAHDEIVLIVAELTANAARHGRVPGRDFQLRLLAAPYAGTARIEVTDTRGERVPERPAVPDAAGGEEGGRGLFLVAALATRWDWHPRPDGPGKTVWAEYARPDEVRPPSKAMCTSATSATFET